MSTKKDKRAIPLKSILNLLQLLILAVTVIFYICGEVRLIRTIEDDVMLRSEAVLDGILADFEDSRGRIASVMELIGQDAFLQGRLEASNLDAADYESYMRPFLAGAPAINGIYLTLSDGRFFASETSRLSRQSADGAAVADAPGISEFYNPLCDSGVFSDSLEFGIYYAAPYSLPGRSGTLLVDINALLLCRNLGANNSLMVCTREGEVIFEGNDLNGVDAEGAMFTGTEGGTAYSRRGSGILLRREAAWAPLVFYYYEPCSILHQSTYNLTVYAALMLVLCLILNLFARRITTRYLLGPILETGRKMQQAYIIGMTETFMLPGEQRRPKSAALSIYFFVLLSVIAPFALFTVLAWGQNARIVDEVYTHYAQAGYLDAIERLQSGLEREESLLDALADQRERTLDEFMEDIGVLYERYSLAGLRHVRLSLFDGEGGLLFRTGMDAVDSLPPGMETGRYDIQDGGPEMLALRAVDFGPEGAGVRGTLAAATDNGKLVEFIHGIEMQGGVVTLSDLSGEAGELAVRVTSQGARTLINMAEDSREAFVWNMNGWVGASVRAYDEGWLITAMIPAGDIRQSAGAVVTGIRYGGAVLLLLMLFVSYLLSMRLSAMIGRVNEYFGSINVLDDKTVQPHDFFISELSVMEKAFNGMVEKNRMLIDELISSNNEKNRVEIMIKDSEIRALQAQINPHFLHNTLNSIVALIDNNQREEAKRVVRMVGTLFRCGISRKDISISIREEIEYLDAYMSIMALRYGKRFAYRITVPEELYRYRTLKLILQPIVENCLMHGQKNNRNLMVTVTAREEEHRIVFEITDNGVGMNETQLYILQKQLEEEGTENHIGLINVQTRLRLNFGPQYGLEVNSAPGEGTVVRVSIKKIPVGDVSG